MLPESAVTLSEPSYSLGSDSQRHPPTELFLLLIYCLIVSGEFFLGRIRTVVFTHFGQTIYGMDSLRFALLFVCEKGIYGKLSTKE